MRSNIGVVLLFGIGIAVTWIGQEVARAQGASRAGNHFQRRSGPVRYDRRDPNTQAREADLNLAAAEFIGKIDSLGPWEKHTGDFAATVDRAFKVSGVKGESEKFFKRVLIETHKPHPKAVRKRFRIFINLIADRYKLGPEHKRKLRQVLIRRGFSLGMKHGPKLVPVIREMLDTRLAQKPITAEQVARWTKVFRPVIEEAQSSIYQDCQPLIKTLSPGQKKLVGKDLAAADKRLKEFSIAMRSSWEKGKWEASHWGLDRDPIQTGMPAGVPASPSRVKPSQVGQGSAGPMRLGDTRGQGGVQVFRQVQGPPLPDEDMWVAYVRSFCARYSLDAAQRATATAILKDLQEQAQAYRGSHSQEIGRRQGELKRAESVQERAAVQAELREVLAGVDTLFDELKKRLENIPTSEQLGGGG